MIMRFKDYLVENGDYRGEHGAPDKHSGAPLYNLANIYPEDIYSANATRYYGDGHSFDSETIYIIQGAKGKPNKKIKIYRAVPANITTQDKINDIEKQKAYILKRGKIPPGVKTNMNSSKYYEFISDELDNLKKRWIETEQKIKINPGDWVSIIKKYAIEHGRSHLDNKYKILTKTVMAKDLYTNGDSIHEWGYDPT